MKSCLILVLFLIIVSALHLHAYSNNVFSKNTTIAHAETSLFLDYVGQYLPAEGIIHISAIFPMTAATCHFLPLSAAEKIPSCNITTKRTKRNTEVMGLGLVNLVVGTVSLALSISNSMQIAYLHQQVASVEDSLSKLSKSVELYGAQLVKLSTKQIDIIAELQVTQKALDDITPVLDSHAKAINNLQTGFQQLLTRVEHSFLYVAITQIYKNDLTLSFLSPEDIHKVVYHVIKEGNLTFSSYPGSLPIVQIITNLLVRQQIDFIPSSQYMSDDSVEYDDPEEIGRLVITSYFAVPRPQQTPFYVYKLVTIPHFHDGEIIELAHIPRYWAINLKNNNTMEWHNQEESGCNIQLMTSCRATPPFRTISKDTCLDEIMEQLPLSKCRITQVPTSKYFIRHLRDNLWITSSSKPMHCVKILKTDGLRGTRLIGALNEEIIHPPVAVVNVTEGYTIVCPGFTLDSRPVSSNTSSLIIMYGHGGNRTKNISVMNVHQYITQNMTWFKRDVAEEERKNLIDFINEKNAISTSHSSLSTYMWPFGMFTANWILFGLIAVVAYHVYRCKRGNNPGNR